MDKSDQLVDEICQITEQYRKEVSTKRRTWPLSIKERVIELKRLGLSGREIFKRTGVPEPTVWVWTTKNPLKRKQKETHFIPVKVDSTVKSLTVKSVPQETRVMGQSGFTVELPNGLKVLNMDLETLIELSRRMT